MPLLASFDEHFIGPSMDDADRLFYDNIVETRPESPRVREVVERIKKDFVPVQTKGNLTLYARRR
jgi:hypothetical protein